MEVEISLQDLRAKGKSTHFVFNVCIVDDGGGGGNYLITAMRVIGGKIYAPSIKIGNKYITVIYVGQKVAKAIYDKLVEKLPEGYALADFESATAKLRINRHVTEIFLNG